MTALTKDGKFDQYGTPDEIYPHLLDFPVEAATSLFGGGMVATNAAGNAVPASSSAALKLWGRCEKQVLNTVAAGFGTAGALRVSVRAGVFEYTNGTGGDVIAQANVGQACYASDDNTVNLTDGGGTRPYAGVIINVRPSGKVAVYVGMPGAYAPESQEGSLQHLVIDVPLATIQAATSGTAFNVGAVLPANVRVMAADINVIQVVAGGSIATSAVAKVQNTGETAGSLAGGSGGANVFTGATLGPAPVTGSNPYPSRGGQQLQMTITTGAGALSGATTGHLAVDIFYVELA